MLEFQLPEDTFLILGCGTIHHRKGADLFVQVAREVVDMGGSERFFFLWIGGDQLGPTFRQWCEHDTQASGLMEKIRFAGYRDSINDYYAAADGFALTSREDPFPLVTLESMARGLPVVAFDGAGGSPEILGGRAGIVVPYLDIKAMARALICLCEAPRFHEEISRNAKEKAESGYRWGRFMRDLLVIIGEDFGYRTSLKD